MFLKGDKLLFDEKFKMFSSYIFNYKHFKTYPLKVEIILEVIVAPFFILVNHTH